MVHTGDKLTTANNTLGQPDRFKCKICGHGIGRVVKSTERMFGMGGDFYYFECGECGCVQLMNVPEDLAPFYPKDKYYSIQPRVTPPAAAQRQSLRLILSRWRNQFALFGTPFIAAPLNALWPLPEDKEFLNQIRHVSCRSLNCCILDVGSGQGQMLMWFANRGFQKLHGVDPFLSTTQSMHPSIKLHKCQLSDLDAGAFDLIVLHHSLEHMPDQMMTLTEIRKRLAPGGVCRIEIPVADSTTWREYGAEWGELDPPRHLFLHTRKSMKILASSAGMEITHTESVATPNEFWISELYRQNKSLYMDDQNRLRRPEDDFNAQEVETFSDRTRKVNANGEAGRLEFWLRSN